MTLPPPKICKRIRQLFRLMGSANPNEAANAHNKLLKLLAQRGLSWNDIPACAAAADVEDTLKAKNTRAATSGPEVNVLDLVLRLLDLHVALTPEERMAVALWILHTHVFDCFPITPRLALLSPVRGCGKTTLLAMVDLLVADPYRSDNITAAAIYYLLHYRRHTLLIDEGDNLGLLNNGVLKAVFNSGHRRGGTISRFVGGSSRRYPTFAPIAVAAIGMMPLPLLHRSVVINMQRAHVRLERLDENDPSFAASREQIQKWAATCSLAQDPEMPPSLRNRTADNWRALLAIADDLGHADAARAAAINLSADRPDEDIGVVLLADIRIVFETSVLDRISSGSLVAALLELDDGIWADWCGPHDERPPRKLNQSELARLLRPFGIRPKTIWPTRRKPDDKSYRGYLCAQFEAAWQAYCPSAVTPTQRSKIMHLPRS